MNGYFDTIVHSTVSWFVLRLTMRASPYLADGGWQRADICALEGNWFNY